MMIFPQACSRSDVPVVTWRSRALLAALLAVVGFAGSQGALAQDRTAAKPNILLIIADDVGIDVTTDMYPGLIDQVMKQYGPTGHKHAHAAAIRGKPASTPRLDRLARQGMTFTNTWAHPFCSPTRASILTGLNGLGTRVLTYADPLSAKHTSFVQLLKDQGGYSTGLFGKWHLSGSPGRAAGAANFPGVKPKQAGFDVFTGNLNAAIPLYTQYDIHAQDTTTPPHEWRSSPAIERTLPGIAPTKYADVAWVADAIDWISAQEKSNPDKPWFAWVAFNSAHATAIQQPSAMTVPDRDLLDAPSLAEMEACGGEFGSNRPGNCSGEALMRAMTNAADTLTGKLLDAVDKLDPNTYVIFIGDNGTPMYGRPNLDFIDNLYLTKKGRGKGTPYQSGARVPLTIRGPQIAAGKTSNELTQAADLFSTTLALAGVEVPGQVSDADGTGKMLLDAVSLAPVLFGKEQSVRDPNRGYVVTETVNLMTNGTRYVGARNGRYTIACTEGAAADACEFYDLVSDPIQEYPLEEPASCEQYGNGTWQPTDQAWHFCRLVEVVLTHSYFKNQK
ncbi:MAG: sulfatase-like hydrolase/transferase [Gammaproteobacteria bacterium]|nr:sulfatase-like hydrolase/transferase [Gammaproteobacteria bacterium]